MPYLSSLRLLLAAALALPLVVVGSGPVAAQSLSGPAVAAAALQGSDAGLVCAQGHLRAAGAAARLETAATLAHRQKMARYDVKYYQLDLALENNSLAVAGSVWMRVRVGAQPLDSLAFELYQAPAGSPAGTATLLIDRVEVGSGGAVSPGVRRVGNDATAALPAAAPAGALLDVRIYYHGTAPSGNSAAIGNGLNSRSAVSFNNISYPYNIIWSLSESFAAHEWFPCKQVLTDKADSSAVLVTTTRPNKVGSNGVLRRTVELPGNKVRYEWHERHPIAYYLISVAVAPYIEHLSYASPAGGPRVPILDYVYNQAALDLYQAAIGRTAGLLENYARLCGPYPFADEKYGHSLAPLGNGSGMEHQTMTTQNDYGYLLTAHELLHQWFGNNVTCAAWTDIWLNEGFASYGEFLSLESGPVGAPITAREWLDDAHFRAQNQRDAQGNWVPRPGGSVRVPDADTTNVSRIFNSALSYKKGATVIHMLRYLLGDDQKFFRALRTYQATYAGRTARTADLQRVFEAEAGRPLDYFFRQWYAGEGFPSFQLRWRQQGNQLLLHTTETVSMPTVTPFFDTELDYKITFSDGTARTERLRQSQPVSEASLPAGGTVAAIELDPDQWVLNGASLITRDEQLVLAAAPPLQLAPNPARDELRFYNLPAPRATAEVLDALGRVVLRQAVAGPTPRLPISQLAPGLYLLRLSSDQGRRLGQGRFVKQ
ncbi:M1 family aminopeptidase [uncultured Hymenobacter sp.]|uniref:M1 family aminopeptidase n=1 Tax=uncultured Hymenobacter sp. TaxID=170016 RepID=UPI0035CC710F